MLRYMTETNNPMPESKICESCGETFGCGAKIDGCWCVEIELESEVADDLKAKYSDCLCPKCLANVASVSEIRRIV